MATLAPTHQRQERTPCSSTQSRPRGRVLALAITSVLAFGVAACSDDPTTLQSPPTPRRPPAALDAGLRPTPPATSTGRPPTTTRR